MTTDPYLAAIVVLVAIVVLALVWALVEPRDEQTVMPLVHAEPAIAPTCEAAHCGLPAFTTAPHVDGTDMWVCPGDLERGCREGWIRQAATT